MPVNSFLRDSSRSTRRRGPAPAGNGGLKAGEEWGGRYLKRLYFRIAPRASIPSFHPIFLPSSYVRPE
jgi:hypothetical protein